MTERIPKDAQDVIARHIHSVAQLETLLFLRARPDVPIKPDILAREQKIGGDMAADLLTDLSGRGFLKETPEGYLYKPTRTLAKGVDAVANAYGTYRVAIINLIFSKPSEGVQSFADAFRVRRDED